MQLHTRHSKMQILPCCSPVCSATPSIFQCPNLPSPPCRASEILLCLALASLHTLSSPPSLVNIPFPQWDGRLQAVSSRLGCPGEAMEEKSWKPPGLGWALHQGHPTPELCHHHCQQASAFWLPPKFCWAPPTPPRSLGWGAGDAGLFPSTPCCNSSSCPELPVPSTAGRQSFWQMTL